MCVDFFFFIVRLTARSTRTDTLLPYTTLFRSALQILGSETAFDLLVTDYSMPSMTGVELIAKAKESGHELGTLIVSGYSDVNERFDIPGVVRLAKPFSLLRSEEHTSEL